MPESRTDYAPLVFAIEKTSKAENVTYAELARITGVPFPKLLHLVTGSSTKGLLAVHVINLARYTETPLSALVCADVSDEVEAVV